jgi:hypothetical protein
MPDPLWFGPPESVAAILELGDPSTVIANVAAWLSEAISNEISMGASMANIAATMSQWVGLGGAASALKGSELNLAGLAPMVAHCLKHVTIGQAAVEASTIARSSVIPAVVCQTNRDETAALHAGNICGCNTPAIVANDIEYFGYFTPQNTSIGLMYAGTLNMLMGAIAATPPLTSLGTASTAPAETTIAEPVASTVAGLPSGPAEAVQAVRQGASTSGDATVLLQPLQQAMSTAPDLAKSVADAPTQVFQGASATFGPLQSLMGMFPGLTQQGAAAAPELAAAESVGAAGGPGAWAGGGAGGAGVGYPGAGLTQFTRPASTFAPQTVGGRPAGLRGSGVLNAAEVRGPTTSAPAGGAAMPVSPAAGMLGRDSADTGKDKVAHARVVTDRDRREPQSC